VCDQVTDKDIAEFLRLGLEGGWVNFSVARQWADRWIETHDVTAEWAIDLSVTSDENVALSLLHAVPGSSRLELSMRLLVGFLKRKWAAECVDLRSVAKNLDKVRCLGKWDSDVVTALMVPELMYEQAEATIEWFASDGKVRSRDEAQSIARSENFLAEESVRTCLSDFDSEETIVYRALGHEDD
jgi:hypothetical protein